MEEIVKEYIDKGVEFAEQFIAKYGQAAWETVLMIKRMEAMQDMAINFALGMFTLLFFSVFIFSAYKNYKAEEAFTKAVLNAETEAEKQGYKYNHYKEKSDHYAAIASVWLGVGATSALTTFALFVFLVIELLSIWEWIGYWYPDVVVAREVMMRLK